MYDNLRPRKVATATATISVSRNLGTPAVSPAFVSVWEYVAEGTNIVNITASDTDSTVIVLI